MDRSISRDGSRLSAGSRAASAVAGSCWCSCESMTSEHHRAPLSRRLPISFISGGRCAESSMGAVAVRRASAAQLYV